MRGILNRRRREVPRPRNSTPRQSNATTSAPGSGSGACRSPRLWAQLRWAWYLLTSMRTALILLFLLALAAVPGSVLPQTGTNPLRVRNFYTKHPHLAPFRDAIGGSERLRFAVVRRGLSVAVRFSRGLRHSAQSPALPRNAGQAAVRPAQPRATATLHDMDDDR